MIDNIMERSIILKKIHFVPIDKALILRPAAFCVGLSSFCFASNASVFASSSKAVNSRYFPFCNKESGLKGSDSC